MLTIGIFMPVIWAAVATIVALVLYRTSEAFFETSSRDKEKGTTKKLRIVGSITIAALCFLGLQRATPAYLLSPIPQGSVIIQKAELESMNTDIEMIEGSLIPIGACVAEKISSCSQELASLQRSVTSAKARSSAWLQRAKQLVAE